MALSAPQIRQYPHGNADAGRGQGAADEKRGEQVLAEKISRRKTEAEGQDHPGRGDHQRLEAGADKAQHIGFETDLEKQEDDADFREQADYRGRLDPSEQARTQYHAGGEFADDRRDAKPRGELTKYPRGQQDREQRQEKEVDFHLFLSRRSRRLAMGV